MYKEVKLFLTISLIGLGAWAQNPDTADPVTKAILAQTKVTEVSINNLVEFMAKSQAGNVYNDPDYQILAVQFKKNLNEAMEIFRIGMNDKILPEAKHWLDAYQANIKQAQDPNFLSAAAKDTRAQLKRVSQDYHELVAQVISHAVTNFNYSFEFQSIAPEPKYCDGHVSSAAGKKLYDVKEYARVPTDWFGKTSILSPRLCEVNIHEDRDWWTSSFLDGKKINMNNQNIADEVEKSRDHWLNSSEESIVAWFEKPDTRPKAFDTGPVLPTIAELQSKWLSSCQTTECKQLRLADLAEFLSAAKLSLLKGIELLPIPDGAFSLDAPPIRVEQLLTIIREFVPRLDQVN